MYVPKSYMLGSLLSMLQ